MLVVRPGLILLGSLALLVLLEQPFIDLSEMGTPFLPTGAQPPSRDIPQNDQAAGVVLPQEIDRFLCADPGTQHRFVNRRPNNGDV